MSQPFKQLVVIAGVLTLASPVSVRPQAVEPVRVTTQQLAEFAGSRSSLVSLGMVNRLSLDREGGIYVVDMMTQQVIRFSPDGGQATSFGRPGQGPGEFSGVASVVPTDSAVQVFDWAQQLIHSFDRQGRFLSAERIPRVSDLNFALGAELKHDYWFGVSPPRLARGGSGRPDLPGKVVIVSPGRTSVEDVLEYSSSTARWFDSDDGLPAGMAEVSFGETGAWAVSGDSLLVVADGSTGVVRWLLVDEVGVRTTRLLDSGVRPRRLGPDDREWVERATREVREARDRRLPRRLSWQFPESAPAITRVILDDEGYVWLRLGVDQESHTFLSWLIVPPGSSETISVEFPEEVDLRAVRGQQLYVVVKDELDVPTIRLLEFDRGLLDHR